MTDDILNKISALLDNSDGNNLYKEFEFLAQTIKNGKNQQQSGLIMAAMAELAERQWEAYEVLPEKIRNDVGESIIDVWDRNSLDSTEKLVGIVAKLGLGNALSYLAAIVKEITNPEVKNEISAAILEFGETVNDPYSGMK